MAEQKRPANGGIKRAKCYRAEPGDSSPNGKWYRVDNAYCSRYFPRTADQVAGTERKLESKRERSSDGASDSVPNVPPEHGQLADSDSSGSRKSSKYSKLHASGTIKSPRAPRIPSKTKAPKIKKKDSLDNADRKGLQGRSFDDSSSEWNLRSTSVDHYWTDTKWIYCLDGKWRRIPVKRELRPLADGIPARVVRLRGYGNAIVPQVAALFIRAFMEVTRRV